MIDRCFRVGNIGYENYGGRGITVCDRWKNSYENFLSDMGRKPSPKHSLDRIDPLGNYEPSNCRWATRIEQANNRRKHVNIIFNGEKLSLSQLAIKTKIHRATINYWKQNQNLSDEDIATKINSYPHR
jgi:hypothetical protein